MILLFTSNVRGGILQFSLKVLNTLRDIDVESVLFVPEEAYANFDAQSKQHCRMYKKPRKLLKNQITDIIEAFAGLKPVIVWFMDEGVVSKYVALNCNIKATILMTVHDILPHPSHINPRSLIVELVKKSLRQKVFEKIDKVILLSEFGVNKFSVKYAQFEEKAMKLTLGAHVPDVPARKPPEMMSGDDNRYFLFFGRIDKYKGLGTLLAAYVDSDLRGKPKLIVAGSGKLTKRENRMAYQTGITLINRFVDDDEMVYLIQNCDAVVLPYIEITQTGILPLAYHFNRPVIISSLPGLVEFVDDGNTGHIFTGAKELTGILEDYSRLDYKNTMAKNISRYYEKEMNWQDNIKSILKEIM
ncbi:MAG: glycosyltransferase family 4 protein [Bacteroidales bacterium]|nr:glycosyltransferase family 4 protein [Bacteroidales bacterium]